MSDNEYARSIKDDLKSLTKKEEHVVTAVFDLKINPLSTNPTKWSNTLKQFVRSRRRIV